jgi:hypothetical protein
MHVFTKIHLSAAFDNEGQRDPGRDEVQANYEGEFPADTNLLQFIQSRYPSVIGVEVLTAESESKRSQIESSLGLIRL